MTRPSLGPFRISDGAAQHGETFTADTGTSDHIAFAIGLSASLAGAAQNVSLLNHEFALLDQIVMCQKRGHAATGAASHRILVDADCRREVPGLSVPTRGDATQREDVQASVVVLACVLS